MNATSKLEILQADVMPSTVLAHPHLTGCTQQPSKAGLLVALRSSGTTELGA